ncbi:uncharacterized protein ISCGN_001544 [Ixodes scapularis]
MQLDVLPPLERLGNDPSSTPLLLSGRDRHTPFWILGCLSALLLLLMLTLGCCSRRRRRTAPALAQASAASAPRRPAPRMPLGDPHSREILLCPACRSAQETMFRLARTRPALVPTEPDPPHWSLPRTPPPPYSPHPIKPETDSRTDSHSHL